VDMAADELILSIQFAPVRTAAYAKLHQRASHYAIVGVAVALELRDGTLAAVRVGLTGAVSHAGRLADVEQALAGHAPSSPEAASAIREAGQTLADINADIHASADYRRAR
jgi:aerobic carbon-monoxide dehydrogenase medium subunit